MKKTLCAVAALLMLVCLTSCAPREAVEVDADFNADKNTLYFAYVIPYYVGEDGFAGSGSFVDHVYVEYPGADAEFEPYDVLKVEFYGKDYSAEEKTVTLTSYPDTDRTCAQTVKKVVSVTRSSYEELIYPAGYDKPIIYLYPEEATECSVRVELDGKLTCSYPEHGKDGWTDFTAYPDGTLVFPDGKEYYALYWEGESVTRFDMRSGFCVKGSEAADFLSDVLPRLGLSAREAEEFIIYWLPQLQSHEYDLISFRTEAYADSARLYVTPEPDTVIRVFMAWEGLDAPVWIEPQEIVTPERKGFTVVEWGGSKLPRR